MKIIAIVITASLLTAAPAFAWGTAGHRTISNLAASSLPAEIPAFVRSPEAIAEITELGPEEDRLKGSGDEWDHDNDPGHFLDVRDDGTIAGVVRLDALPPNLDAFDAALRSAHTTPWKQGYLPYKILEGWQEIRKDFAIWRVDDYEAQHATSNADRARFASDELLRQEVTPLDIGVWSHFVADGSQPLHVTVHYNGWDNYPNPRGYTNSHRTHALFESDFVDAHANVGEIRSLMPAYVPVNPGSETSQAHLLGMIGTYLAGSQAAVVPLYELQKSGEFDRATPKAITFTDAQLARGATELRDLIALAWEDSLNVSVSYPEVNVRDVLSGKATLPPP
jgi:hypothetical protein